MNASELVGFLITILVLLIALTRRLREEKFRREHPEEYAEKVKKEEEAYKAFLRSLDIPIEEEGPPQMKKKRPKAPPPPPTSAAAQGAYVPRSTVAEGFEFHSNLDSFRQRSDIDKRHLRSAVADRRGSDLVSEHLRDQPEQNAYRLRKDEESKAHAFLAGLPTKKALLLAHEIFGPPKSMEE